jgi:hypothetical protein
MVVGNDVDKDDDDEDNTTTTATTTMADAVGGMATTG